MEIIKADVLGYCMGVKRAVESAEQALDDADSSAKVYTLGPLIHNPSVLSHLQSRGVQILDSSNLDELNSSSIIIIRAHGTTPAVLDKLSQSGAQIIDSTCPRVHLSQKRVTDFSAKGAQIIIAGDKNHGEVISISSYSRDGAVVIQNVDEASALNVKENAVFISQTTFSVEEFGKMEKILKEKNPSIVVFNSICPATAERQKALRRLENSSDGILIVGGKSSANTKRLYEIACSICGRAALIEDASEIPQDFFSMEKVAITAGASTPDFIISQVEDTLLKNGGKK